MAARAAHSLVRFIGIVKLDSEKSHRPPAAGRAKGARYSPARHLCICTNSMQRTRRSSVPTGRRTTKPRKTYRISIRPAWHIDCLILLQSTTTAVRSDCQGHCRPAAQGSTRLAGRVAQSSGPSHDSPCIPVANPAWPPHSLPLSGASRIGAGEDGKTSHIGARLFGIRALQRRLSKGELEWPISRLRNS